MKKTTFCPIFILALFVCSALPIRPVCAGILSENFEIRGDILGYAMFQDVENSNLNPYNIIGLADKKLQIAARPDFFLTFEAQRLSFEFKPRFTADQTTWDDGIYELKSDEGDTDAAVNEWLVRYGVTDKVFISGGRENLQWGPSYLLSPSNPFIRDNGKNNPYLELPGLDYVRAVLIPNSIWTVSLIANVGEGRYEGLENFKNTYALKTDYTGYEKYAGFIVSGREGDQPEFGLYGGLTMTDYLLLYTEGSISLESDRVDILGGGSYTLQDGSAFSLEYFHQGSGTATEPIERALVPEGLYQDLQDRFSDFDGSPNELLAEIEALDLDFNLPALVRKNYVMLQYVKPEIRDVLTLTGRWIYNVDDTSNRAVGIVNWEVNSRLTVLTVGNAFIGGTDTEFGSLLNHSLMAGVQYHF